MNFFVQALRSLSSSLLKRPGPLGCLSSREACPVFGASHIELKPSASYTYCLPRTEQKDLLHFLAKKRISQIPALSISIIPGGRVYRGTVILTPDCKYVLRDLSAALYEHSNTALHSLLDTPIRRSIFLRGSTLAVAVDGATSYYHWLLEELPRMLLPGLPSVDRVLISKPGEARLNALNLVRPCLPFLFRKFCWPGRLSLHVSCENLVCPSYLSSSGELSPYIVELLQDLADKIARPDSSLPEKILISRSSQHGRNLSSEAPLAEALAQEGFRRVELEKLDFAKQIQLFRNAKEIISPHGAGLANLVFCTKKPLVIEIFNSSYVHWCFWHLASLVEATYLPLSLPLGSKVFHDPASSCKAAIPIISVVKFMKYRDAFMNA